MKPKHLLFLTLQLCVALTVIGQNEFGIKLDGHTQYSPRTTTYTSPLLPSPVKADGKTIRGAGLSVFYNARIVKGIYFITELGVSQLHRDYSIAGLDFKGVDNILNLRGLMSVDIIEDKLSCSFGGAIVFNRYPRYLDRDFKSTYEEGKLVILDYIFGLDYKFDHLFIQVRTSGYFFLPQNIGYEHISTPGRIVQIFSPGTFAHLGIGWRFKKN